MKENTETIISRLTERLDLDRIFMASYDLLGVSHTHLLLVIQPESGLSTKVLSPVVELCLLDQPQFSFEIILFGEWKNKLKHGSIFYAYLSLPEHQIYSSGKKTSKDLSLRDITGITTLFSEKRNHHENHAEEFNKGANQFVEQKNYLKACFMLHQSMKHKLTLLQKFVLSKANKSPHLVNKLRSLSTQLPVITSQLDLGDSFDPEILRIIDHAHAAVKQNRIIEITQEDYEATSYMWSQLEAEFTKLYDQIFEKLQQEIGKRKIIQTEHQTVEKENENNMTSATASRHTILEDFTNYPWPRTYVDAVNELVDHVQKGHNPEEIILLNYKTGGFSRPFLTSSSNQSNPEGSKIELYLIVLMKKRGPIKQRDIKMGKASALVLFFDVEKFRVNLVDNQSPNHRFYFNVIQNGLPVRRKKSFIEPWQSIDMDWKKQHEHAKYLFANTYRQMGELERLLQNVESHDHDMISFLLGHLIEKGIKLFIKMHLGFVPKELLLDQLVDFTTVIDNRILDYLMPRSKSEEISLATLLNYEHAWNECHQLEKISPMERTPLQFTKNWLEFIYNISIEGLKFMEEKLK